MKHFNRYSLAALPLLSILAMSPSVMESHFASRGIASVELEKVEIPESKLEVENIKPEITPNKLDLQTEEVITKEEIKPDLKVEVEDIKPEIKPIEIAKQDDKLELELVEIEAPKIDIVVEDIKLEPVELNIDTDELLVIEKEEIKPDLKVEVDDIKPEIKPIKVGDLKVEEEEKKEEKKSEEVCEQDEKVQALSGQVEALVAQQNQIMQSMLNMTQMMMMQSMMIQQQMMLSQMNSMGTQNSPYQYANQTTAGNWVYYPQGFQPQQPNIFAQPQMGGFYPDQAHSNWNLTPGTFGPMSLGNGMNYDMTPGAAPQMPVQAQAGRTLGPIM